MKELLVQKEKRGWGVGERSSISLQGPPHAACQRVSWVWLKFCTSPQQDFSYSSFFFLFLFNQLPAKSVSVPQEYIQVSVEVLHWGSGVGIGGGFFWEQDFNTNRDDSQPICRLWSFESGNRDEVSGPKWRSTVLYAQFPRHAMQTRCVQNNKGQRYLNTPGRRFTLWHSYCCSH